MGNPKLRRVIALLFMLAIGSILFVVPPDSGVAPADSPDTTPIVLNSDGENALQALELVAVKGRAPKTNYSRSQFGNGWSSVDGCDTRNIILARDLNNLVVGEGCKVMSGDYDDPYTGEAIRFTRGASTSARVQIDHVVALSDAWQKGAQSWTLDRRTEFANDPLELLAVDGQANQEKSGSDAATWLPSYKPFRCQYVARQIAVKQKYSLWVTTSEKAAMKRILNSCPDQKLPSGL